LSATEFKISIDEDDVCKNHGPRLHRQPGHDHSILQPDRDQYHEVENERNYAGVHVVRSYRRLSDEGNSPDGQGEAEDQIGEALDAISRNGTTGFSISCILFSLPYRCLAAQRKIFRLGLNPRTTIN
jgi:hypothetical protein